MLDRPVALKELLSANEGTRRRFIREALITARLQHPSIVPVYDAGRLGDRSPFYAMKLVAGQPLARLWDARTGKLHEAALEKALAPVMKDGRNITVALRCKDNKAFAAALAKTRFR